MRTDLKKLLLFAAAVALALGVLASCSASSNDTNFKIFSYEVPEQYNVNSVIDDQVLLVKKEENQIVTLIVFVRLDEEGLEGYGLGRQYDRDSARETLERQGNEFVTIAGYEAAAFTVDVDNAGEEPWVLILADEDAYCVGMTKADEFGDETYPLTEEDRATFDSFLETIKRKE